MPLTKTRMRNLGGLAAVLLGGCCLGVCASPLPATTAEITRTPVPPAFQAGDQQSLPVLAEMAATLKRIDARLEQINGRLERIEKTLSTPRQP